MPTGDTNINDVHDSRLAVAQPGRDMTGDVVAGNKQVFSGDRNVNILGNLTIYLTSRPQEQEAPPAAVDIGPNPYKGLSAFQETDADRFFGRETLTQQLYEKFCQLHDVSFPSPRPSLERKPTPPPYKEGKPTPTPSQEGNCRVTTKPETPLLGGEFTADGLRRIADVLPEIDAAPLILLIDQFEEIYSLCENADERQQFLENLLCAAADRSGHVSVILTLRSDFLGQTQSHPRLNHAIAASNVIVPVMSEAELRQAIAEPARLAGHPLDDATIDLLIKDSEGREGALPLLQFALTKIWDGLAAGVSPAETLKQIGGVGGALAGEAQRLFDRLSDPDKAIARRAFLGLIQLGEGTRDTRRRISVTEIVAHGEDAAQVQAVLRCFADPRARLVTLSASVEGSETAEVTHEALLDHWTTLKEWLDSSRDDLRFHRHLAEDAKYWAAQKKPDGLLWRPPDLDLLRQYHDRAGQEMTPLQVEFFAASIKKEQDAKRLKRLTITAFIVLAIISSCAAVIAFIGYQEAKHQSHVAVIRSLVAYALQDNAQEKRERAALLARHAYLLNQKYQKYRGNVQQELIDNALNTIFRADSIAEEPGSNVLEEQVCEKVKFTVKLTPEEWNEFVGTDIPHEPACPDLPDVFPQRLRREKMAAADVTALSLNLREDNSWGYPIHYVDNRFEPQHDGQVIVDKTTGLMWQQSGSPERLTYEDAQEYIKTLNEQKFAGYDDWRLPTVEELLSLLEKTEENAGRFFRLDAQSFEQLKGGENPVPEEVLAQLQPLRHQKFFAEADFLDAARQRIGEEATSRYQTRIVEQAKNDYSLYINPLFDGVQTWVWSADIYRIKGEGSAESAWYVNFLSGGVHWNFLNDSLYVRGVRS